MEYYFYPVSRDLTIPIMREPSVLDSFSGDKTQRSQRAAEGSFGDSHVSFQSRNLGEDLGKEL